MKIAAIHGFNDYKSQDGLMPIYIKVNIGDKRKIYPIGVKIKEGEWDAKAQRVSNKRVNSDEINIKIVSIKAAIEREYLKDSSVDIANLIQSIIDPKQIKNETEHTLLTYFKWYIEASGGEKPKIVNKQTGLPVSKGYINTLETSLSRLEAFAKEKKLKLNFNDITQDLHISLLNYLRYDHEAPEDITGLAENSISKTVVHIKTVMRYAMKKKLHTNIDFEDFMAPSYEVDNIALSVGEVESIMNLNLTDSPHLAREQDRFIIAYNFLLRFNDSISILKRNIFFNEEKPYLNMNTQKTKQRVIIPIMKRTYEILEKCNYKIPPTSNKNSNENLRKIGELAGITQDWTITEMRKGKRISTTYKRNELISTHTTRRSAATNLYLGGENLKSIQLMGGWKSMKQLEDYLKVDKLENAIKASENKHFA